MLWWLIAYVLGGILLGEGADWANRKKTGHRLRVGPLVVIWVLWPLALVLGLIKVIRGQV